jgi:hypothetical protein
LATEIELEAESAPETWSEEPTEEEADELKPP